jgi:hypothetical protein
MTDEQEEADCQDRQGLYDQQSTDRRVVRLPCRSNNTEQSRAQPWLVLGSCLSSEVAWAWDEVGCMP